MFVPLTVCSRLTALLQNLAGFVVYPNFQDGPTSTLRRGVEQADHSVAQLVHPCRHVDGSHSRSACAVRGPVAVRLDSPTALFRDTPAASPPVPNGPRSSCRALDHVGCHASRSMRPRICRKRLLVK